MTFTLRLCILLCLMSGAICLAMTNRAPVEQTLPSPYFTGEDIQYFPPGPEFKLQREAAAMKAHKTDLESQQAGPLNCGF